MATHFYKYLRDDSNSNDASVDGSTTPHEFYFEAPERCKINRMIILIRDVGAPDAGAYGNNITMSNGLTFRWLDSDGNVRLDLFDDDPIKTNADWAKVSYDVSVLSFGTGNDSVTCRWTFGNSGAPLQMKPGDRLVLTVSDNLLDLEGHFFMLQGTV